MPFSFPKAQGPTLCLPVFTLPRLAQSHNLSTSLLPYIHLSKEVVPSCQTQNCMLCRTCISRQKSRDIRKGQGNLMLEIGLSWPKKPHQMPEYGVAIGQLVPWWSLPKMYCVTLWCFERRLCLPSPAQARSPPGSHGECFLSAGPSSLCMCFCSGKQHFIVQLNSVKLINSYFNCSPPRFWCPFPL